MRGHALAADLGGDPHTVAHARTHRQPASEQLLALPAETTRVGPEGVAVGRVDPLPACMDVDAEQSERGGFVDRGAEEHRANATFIDRSSDVLAVVVVVMAKEAVCWSALQVKPVVGTALRPAQWPMPTYSPAETVERSGFSIETLRYFEREGLLYEIARDSAGRRAYSDRDLAWLQILRCLRDTGMPIAQMHRYAQLTVDDGSIDERLCLLREHDKAVTAQLAQLHGWQAHLREKIAYYEALEFGATRADRAR